MPDMESTPTPTVQLLGKLENVYRAVQYVEKRGQNDHHQYAYAMALDVIRDIRAALLAEKVIVVPGTIAGSIRHHTETGGRSFVTTVDLLYRFIDTETGAELTVPWTAAGADTGGDKGLYKAYTGGLKYALISLFLLPMTEDPEGDALTQRNAPAPQAQAQAASPSADKDAERPAAPRIPLDRARLIADAAVAAGLASWEKDEGDETPRFVMSPVLKAKLAELGVVQLGALNSDTAEAMDAFIAAEATA